jgi:GDP/UDP-N,N'-diacetylbacillosamine 2-epimerase (hydrolysing)
MKKRKILFITAVRSEFYIQKPILDAVRNHQKLECLLIISGAHLQNNNAGCINEIKENGYKIVAKIDNLDREDKLKGRLRGLSNQLNKLVDIVDKVKPDVIIAPYDREEALTMAICGAYLEIPVVHIGAGDKTLVNVDGVVRHSVTKLSNFMMTATEESKSRVISMGVDKGSVFNTGHAGIDRFKNVEKLSKLQIYKYFDFQDISKPLVLFIKHPVSEEIEKSAHHMKVSLDALNNLMMPVIIIKPNSDPGRKKMVSVLDSYEFSYKEVRIVDNIPESIFVNVLRLSNVLVGNSSMGVIEAPYFNLPVVNIGKRQSGRENAGNIIFVNHNIKEIVSAINMSVFNKSYREKIKNIKSPYGNGGTGIKIAKILSELIL